MTDIISDNGLALDDHQVYVDPGAANAEFAYSDGEEVESYLDGVLAKAADLSTGSKELQNSIIDWPTEYHLSGDRANLLRPFNLDGVERVLELGSGCGAISRYLGELGKQVDAIEGSHTRARLGRMRCRDLDNVRVINTNYNDLTIPERHYDLVLFVGVIEYASRFYPQAQSDRDAARHILEAARRLLAPGGVVLVAIENRLGMKYQLGAHEDHYGNRYIGIDGYRNSAGIATYSAPEWRSMAEDAGFGTPLFSYPFPDYKLPKVVLSEQYAAEHSEASNHLEGLVSRDYYAPVKRSITETICWQAASGGGYLGDVANSYIVLLGDNTDRLHALQDFDFCHGPGRGRRPEFAVVTKKLRDETVVRKTLLHRSIDTRDAEGVSGVRQTLQPDAYHRGQLLSARWLRDIAIYVRRQEFEQNLRAYYQFLIEAEGNGSLAIDMLPINVIVDQDENWEVFDQEWQVGWPLTAPYLLFRALLTFIVSNWIYLGDFLRWLELQTVRDFVEYGFHANQIHLTAELEQFIEQESRFQRSIASDPDSIDVHELLSTAFAFDGDARDNESNDVYSVLWWRSQNGQWDTARSATVSGPADPAPRTLSFQVGAVDALAAIRFDPFDLRKPDHVGFFGIYGIRLLEQTGDHCHKVWSLDEPDALAHSCRSEGAMFERGTIGGREVATWIATSDFPKLEFELDPQVALNSENSYLVEIDLSITRSAEYALAWQHYLVRAGDGEKRAKRAEMNLISLKTTTDHERDLLQERLEKVTHHANNHVAEIESIKRSRAFRIATRITGLIAPLKKNRKSD